MIQLHNFSLTAPVSSAGASSSNSSNPSNLASFESALSDAISATFKQFGIDPNSVNISITPESSAASSGSTGNSATANSAPVTETAPYDPFLQAASEKPLNTNIAPATAPSSAAASSATTSSSANSSATTDPTQSFDDAYWAKQPSAVQALRYMQPEGRAAAARNLASEGYTIDVPIMVWGWDPQIATQIRQAAGYTWVPSGLQNPIESMPGIAPLSGLTAYNPNQPPAGSILV